VIRVVIAEDHHLVRDGLRALLERAGDMEVVGEATNGVEAVELVERERPDVIVMDVTMPERNGIEATHLIRSLDTSTEVVMLSMHAEPALIRRSMLAGAKGYVLKGSVTEELLLAVRSAYRGATYLTPIASESILNSDTGSPSSQSADLTPRELEVLHLIGDGFTNRAIASRLSISVKTVERHRTSVMAKLGVHSIVELMRESFRLGLLDVEQ
jgi:DNA-binding NarL/FixJ family response regulator